jgi:hypothetical protein
MSRVFVAASVGLISTTPSSALTYQRTACSTNGASSRADRSFFAGARRVALRAGMAAEGDLDGGLCHISPCR